MSATTVGFIGLGHLGEPAAFNLLNKGFDVTVHDLRPEAGRRLVAAGALIVEWVLISAFVEAVISPRPAYFKYLMTIALYPVVAWLFARMQRTLPVVE